MLAGVMLMFMLIGVLCEVVSAIASTEKEGILAGNVAGGLREAFVSLGMDHDAPLSKRQFQELLYEPLIVDRLTDVGTDPVVLLDMSEVIFDSLDKDGQGMRFEKFVDVVLSMRGHNLATVKDTTSQLLVIKNIVKMTQDLIMQKLHEEITQLKGAISDLSDRPGLFEDDDHEGYGDHGNESVGFNQRTSDRQS